MSRTKQSVQRELKQHYDNLGRIEEKIAIYTELDAPVYLLNQRDQAQQRIAGLEALLEAGGLPDEAAPTYDVIAPFMSNAPPLPSHHVPREEVLDDLREMLLSEERQGAVTALRGMGGVGKTTLAIALCHDEAVREAFRDGILWADLGPEGDVLRAQARWGAVLGHKDLIELPDAETRADRLRRVLQDKRCLLVIDDVWDAAHLSPLCVGGPECVTLVTTRERHVAQDEDVGYEHTLGVLKPDEAVALLESWASQHDAGTRKEAAELAERLGYLPLALRLAGAQALDDVKWMKLLARFREAQGDLSALDLDEPTRKKSLTLAFDLSLERLSEDLQARFEMLGVFAAGRESLFTSEAAAAVWQVTPDQAEEALKRLGRAALLDRVGDACALHPLLGDYARSRLDEATRQAAEARHSTYYLGVAKRSEEEWEVAEAALPQMRTAWGRVAKDDADNLYAWATAAYRFFGRRGYRATKIAWLKAALVAVQAAGQRKREGWCRHELGVVYYRLGKFDKALEQFQASLTIRREMSDRIGEAETLNYIGQIYFQHGDFDTALEQFQASLAIFREMDQQLGEVQSRHHIGRVHSRRGQLDKALEQFQASLIVASEVGSRGGEAWLLYDIGRIHRQRGKLDEAIKQYRASLAICREIGERTGQAKLLWSMGVIYEHKGRLVEAEKHLAEALDLYEDIGMPQAEEVRKDLARVRGQLGGGSRDGR
jgi:tetratricopeptide (TPR) repeat protein